MSASLISKLAGLKMSTPARVTPRPNAYGDPTFTALSSNFPAPGVESHTIIAIGSYFIASAGPIVRQFEEQLGQYSFIRKPGLLCRAGMGADMRASIGNTDETTRTI